MEDDISKTTTSSSSSCISSAATNWVVTHGSLDASISFDTPDSAIEEEEEEGSIIVRDQLQLIKPSSSDPDPCEITISFKKRHEIRQVYVRSTARVYEMYYATDQQSSNEYLCTVRCSAAVNGDESPHASDTEEAIISNGNSNASDTEEAPKTKELVPDKITNVSSNGKDEDGWVEVKVPDDKINRSTKRRIQDLYEATAEISDADPCISLTLRMLSLQERGSVQIEEIYIFAEPVESASSESQGPMQNSAGNSLMAMLVPTLLSMSKARNNGKQDRHGSDIKEISQDDKATETKSLKPNVGVAKQLEEQSSVLGGENPEVEKVTKGSTESRQFESGKQVPSKGQGHDSVAQETDPLYSRVEKVLDHLVYRVSRVEAFCLRFEENMLKPISNIETRLQVLEKQLELLTTRSQPTEVHPSTRIIAPEFSCSEFQSNSIYNDGNDDQYPGALDLASRDTRYTRITAPEFVCTESGLNSFPNDAVDDHNFKESESIGDADVGKPSSSKDDPHFSTVVSNSCPALVITAPEFPYEDDDECGEHTDRDISENNCSTTSASYEKRCSRDKPSVSLDDALASALAGFISMASDQPSKYAETFELTGTNEGGSDNHELTSTSPNPLEQDADAGQVCVSQAIEQTNENLSEVENEASIGQGQSQELKGRFGDNDTSQTGSWNNRPYLIPNGTLDDDWYGTLSSASGTGTETATPLENQQNPEQNINTLANDVPGAISCNFATMTSTAAATETQCAENRKSESENLLKKTYNTMVNFELPILDVKFVPQENWNSGSSLEFLLDDIPKSKTEDEDYEAASPERRELLILEDKVLCTPNLNEQHLVHIDDFECPT